MAVSRKVPGTSARRYAGWCLVLLQTGTDVLDERGRFVPHCGVGARGHDDVLQPPHRRHESGQLRRCVNRCDPCEFADIVLGVGHFHASMRSSVVVMVARSDSVLSMIEAAYSVGMPATASRGTTTR